jgi:hypothetical protein
MPGRLGRNLRRGHRAERLGVERLGAFCAVAPVPQSEDIGFDAVATVLRLEGRFWMAEGSFCIQFKARSVREIPYNQAEYEWLRTLALPLFIGSVDLKSQTVALYTTHNIACRIDAHSYQSVVLRLDPPSQIEGRVLHEYLGEPILRWTPRQAESKKFQKRAHSVLAAWVGIEQLHHPLRTIRTTELVRWQTNEIPNAAGMMLTGHPDDLRRDIAAAAPYLMKLGGHLLGQGATAADAIGFWLLANLKEADGVEHLKHIAPLLASVASRLAASAQAQS